MGVFRAIMKPHLTANYSLANGCSACVRVWDAASQGQKTHYGGLCSGSVISAISKDDVVTAFLASNAMSFK